MCFTLLRSVTLRYVTSQQKNVTFCNFFYMGSNNEEFARIYRELERLEISQAKLGRWIQKTNATISRYLKGTQGVPNSTLDLLKYTLTSKGLSHLLSPPTSAGKSEPLHDKLNEHIEWLTALSEEDRIQFLKEAEVRKHGFQKKHRPPHASKPKDPKSNQLDLKAARETIDQEIEIQARERESK